MRPSTDRVRGALRSDEPHACTLLKNGRLTLDEPTDLPEGSVVLSRLRLPNDWDELDDEERAKLHESLRESIEQMKAGKAIDLEQALAELHAHR